MNRSAFTGFVAFVAFNLATSSAFALPLTSTLESAEQELGLDVSADHFDGIVRFPGCSGAVVRLTQDRGAKAIAMTNGHCYKLLPPGQFAANVAVSSNVSVYNQDGKATPHRLTRLIYSTMTSTDVSLYEMDVTYQQLEAEGVHAYLIQATPMASGEKIAMISGYFHSYQTCQVEAVIPELREANWKFLGAYKYQECVSIHGTSGSPLISLTSGSIVGINNTHNDAGERCTLNNPCEVDAHGEISVVHGKSYGQRVDQIQTCVNRAGVFDLRVAGCALLH